MKKKETKWTGLLCAHERFSQHQLRKCLLHVCNSDWERLKFNRSRNLERNLDLRIKQKCDFAKLPWQERLAHVLERFHKLVKMNGTHWIGFNISNACFNILALRVRVDSFDFSICNSPLKRRNSKQQWPTLWCDRHHRFSDFVRSFCYFQNKKKRGQDPSLRFAFSLHQTCEKKNPFTTFLL